MIFKISLAERMRANQAVLYGEGVGSCDLCFRERNDLYQVQGFRLCRGCRRHP